MAATNYYDDLISRLIGDGVPLPVVIERAAGAYLDGKPLPVGKKKLTKKERGLLFWASDVVKGCPPDAWGGEAMSLALARYLGQGKRSIMHLLVAGVRDRQTCCIGSVG